MPLTPDRRTMGTLTCSYDFQDGGFDDIQFSIMRRFHCVELIAMLGFEKDEGHWDTSFSMQARLLALEVPLAPRTNDLLSTANTRNRNVIGNDD